MDSTHNSSSYVRTNTRNLSRQKEPELKEPEEGMLLNLKISYLKHDDILNGPNSSIPNFFRVTVERKELSGLTEDTIVKSLYDPALGIPPMVGGLSIGECSTCQSRTCTGGHFGVILFTNQSKQNFKGSETQAIQKPAKRHNKIFNPNDAPFKEAVRIASCMCNTCGTLILSEKYLESKNVLNTPEINRLALVEVLTAKTQVRDRQCKCKTRDYEKKASRNDGQILYKESPSTTSKSISAMDWYDTVEKLAISGDLKYLGYKKLTDLDKCTLVGVPVPGIEMRLPKMIDGNQSPHEYSQQLSVIVDCANKWKQEIRRNKIFNKLKDFSLNYIGEKALTKALNTVNTLNNEKASEQGKGSQRKGKGKSPTLDEQISLAILQVAFLRKLSAELGSEWVEGEVEFQTAGKENTYMKELYKAVKLYSDTVGSKFLSKEGIMRGEVNAKRSDFSARAVITPSSYRLDVVEVPEKLAHKCGIQDDVTEANLAKYRIMLGQRRINHIVSYRNGKPFPINVTLTSISLGRCQIQIGDRITRWLMDGDVALVGRQPSLHPGNMYAFYVKIVDRSTIGLPFPVTVPFAGDFDGDTVSISFPQSPEARAEAIDLAHSRKNIIGVRSGAPIMGIIYNALKSINVMTTIEAPIEKSIFFDALTLIEMNPASIPNAMSTGAVPDIERFQARCLAHGIHPFSGKALFSYLLPENFNYPANGKPSSRGVLIINGILVRGSIQKQEISANVQGTIVHYIQVHYGWEAAASFIERGSILGEYFSGVFPAAMSALDCLGENCIESEQMIRDELQGIKSKLKELGPEPTDAYDLDRYNSKLSDVLQRTNLVNQNLYKNFAKSEGKKEWREKYLKVKGLYEKLLTSIREESFKGDKEKRDLLLSLVKNNGSQGDSFDQIVEKVVSDEALSDRDFSVVMFRLKRNRDVNITLAEYDTLKHALKNPDSTDKSIVLKIMEKINPSTRRLQGVVDSLYNGEEVNSDDILKLMSTLALSYDVLLKMNDEAVYNQFYLGIESGTKGSAQEFGEMIGIIGQLSTTDTLFTKDTSHGTRCSTAFRVDDEDPTSRGFISSNYVTGLTANEKFKASIPQRMAAGYAVGATRDSGVIEQELANSIGKYRTEINAMTSETSHVLQLLAGEDGLGVYKSIEVNGVQLPFDPRTLVSFVNNQLGWTKLADGNWYHRHSVFTEVNGKRQEKVYYVKQ